MECVGSFVEDRGLCWGPDDFVYTFSVCPSCSPGTMHQLPTSILIPKNMPGGYVESLKLPKASPSLIICTLPKVEATLRATLDDDTQGWRA